jgi:pilus assembly protein Flp/PilA
MTQLKQLITRLVRNEEGQDMVEYALLAGFVALAAGALLPDIAQNITTLFSKLNSALTAANSYGS